MLSGTIRRRKGEARGAALTPLPWEDSMAKVRPTTHRNASGKKLYAVRDAKGRFTDIQTYERAHRADLRQKSKAVR